MTCLHPRCSAARSPDNTKMMQLSATPHQQLSTCRKRVWSHSTARDSTTSYPLKIRKNFSLCLHPTSINCPRLSQFSLQHVTRLRKSANSSEKILTIYSNQHPAERVSALPLSGSSADSTVWDPEGDTSRPEQLTSSPASTPTGWLTGGLTEWLGGRLDDWETDLHSAGGSRNWKSHSPHRPADSLPGCRDGWMTSLTAALARNLLPEHQPEQKTERLTDWRTVKYNKQTDWLTWMLSQWMADEITKWRTWQPTKS